MEYKNGLLLHFKLYDESGKMTKEEQYKYDDQGNQIERK